MILIIYHCMTNWTVYNYEQNYYMSNLAKFIQVEITFIYLLKHKLITTKFDLV